MEFARTDSKEERGVRCRERVEDGGKVEIWLCFLPVPKRTHS